jgi:signal transduction histidine kinase
MWVTLVTWLIVGVQTKPTADIVVRLLDGQQVHYGWRTLLIPITWLASLSSVTHVLQSRSEYVHTYQDLQETATDLLELERTSHEKLDAERQQLITTVQQTIQPVLEQIAYEIRHLGNRVSADSFRNLVQQVDDYSIHTVRRLIDELFTDSVDPKTPSRLARRTQRIPLLNWRRLTLDPWCTFWIALSVSVAATLPASALHQQMTMVAQVVTMLTPVFVLHYVRRWKPFQNHTEPVIWVAVACLIVGAFRLSLPDDSPLLVLRNSPGELPLIMALLYALSIVLGALNRYFSDSYIVATQEQEQVNAQLELSVQKNELARQVVRRNVGRIMHGPIQGRLAAIRLKLHLLSDTSSNAEPVLNEDDTAQVLHLLEQISREIRNLGDERSKPHTIHLNDALSALALKWRGIMRVTFDVSHEAQRTLTDTNSLALKLVASCSEAITNASRHGYATKVEISITLSAEKSIELTVIDDGRGVKGAVTAGIGLKDIQEDGGIWCFDPCDTGATLRVQFPLLGTPIQQAPQTFASEDQQTGSR